MLGETQLYAMRCDAMLGEGRWTKDGWTDGGSRRGHVWDGMEWAEQLENRLLVDWRMEWRCSFVSKKRGREKRVDWREGEREKSKRRVRKVM